MTLHASLVTVVEEVGMKELSSTPALATRLLDENTDDAAAMVRSIGASLALAATYGLAIGARYGASSMAVHAIGVPIGLAAATLLTGPALFVGLAHASLDVAPRAMARAVARGLATASLVLAGLAPTALLVTLSAETNLGAAMVSTAGLACGGLLGLWHVTRGLAEVACAAPGQPPRALSRLLIRGAALFAALAACRMWWLLLPALGRPALEGALP